MHSDNNITQFDFWDTYLPQYEMVFTQAKVRWSSRLEEKTESEMGFLNCNSLVVGRWRHVQLSGRERVRH